MKDREVTVDVTPNGLADAVIDDKYFVKPEIRKMKFSTFLDEIEDAYRNKKKPEDILYIQHQNSNFMDPSFSNLWKDVDLDVKFASIALNKKPDAVNIWIGTSYSESSLHKDHYENLYAVISGEKHFTLYPPSDLPYMYYRTFTSATYAKKDGKWTIEVDKPETRVPWIPIDPHDVDYMKYPNFKKATPYEIVVKEGEMLYLPSLWFHKVRQKEDEEGKQISINFWYDMEYNMMYNYFKFMEKLVE